MTRTLHQLAGIYGVLSLAIVALAAAESRAVFTTFEGSGATPALVAPTRDSFRAAIGGGTVAGANGSFGGIRREINWDGVPDSVADPNAFPANFFNSNSPRGAVFSTPGSGFLVSANAGGSTATLFGFPSDFQTFSAQRLFTAVNSNITDVNFFLPGTSTPATTSAFGVIFTDVETANTTKLEFFDQTNALIYSHFVPTTSNQELIFSGAVAANGEQISRVRITSGLNVITANGTLGNPNDDVVVMDDFIYAEPTNVPEPGTLVLALGGIAVAGQIGLRRRRK